MSTVTFIDVILKEFNSKWRRVFKYHRRVLKQMPVNCAWFLENTQEYTDPSDWTVYIRTVCLYFVFNWLRLISFPVFWFFQAWDYISLQHFLKSVQKRKNKTKQLCFMVPILLNYWINVELSPLKIITGYEWLFPNLCSWSCCFCFPTGRITNSWYLCSLFCLQCRTSQICQAGSS